MTEHNLQVNFNPASGNAFGDQAVVSTWADGAPHENLVIHVHNTGSEDINVVLDFAFESHETGWLKPGQSAKVIKKLPAISGSGTVPCKITRWRPGAFGVSGNGGGEVTFALPFEAARATIELNVPK